MVDKSINFNRIILVNHIKDRSVELNTIFAEYNSIIKSLYITINDFGEQNLIIMNQLLHV
jgi:hypothetical protein